jgi:hypothetical protein
MTMNGRAAFFALAVFLTPASAFAQSCPQPPKRGITTRMASAAGQLMVCSA